MAALQLTIVGFLPGDRVSWVAKFDVGPIVGEPMAPDLRKEK
jgi:hypothetical protein